MSKLSKAQKKAAKKSNESSAESSSLINNVLISENFKALRYGKYATANGDNGEFMLDFDDKDKLPSAATLLEIAKKNKCDVKNKKAKKSELALELQQNLASRKVPEQNEKTDSMKVDDIVKAGTAKGLDDEDMIVQIIDSGIKYKAAGRMFAHAMAQGGHRISTKERKERINKILIDEQFEPETHEEVTAMAERIAKEIPETTESQAVRFIRTHCKTTEVEFPKPVKAPRGGFRKQVQDHVVENPLITKGEFEVYITEKRNKDQKVADRMWPAVEFAQKVAAATIKLSDQDSDDDNDADDTDEDTED